uniref:hypothetical protein n=1 Tax=Enterocloster clostridioformis TaxID=1531 RepID=UPI0025A59F9B
GCTPASQCLKASVSGYPLCAGQDVLGSLISPFRKRKRKYMRTRLILLRTVEADQPTSELMNRFKWV